MRTYLILLSLAGLTAGIIHIVSAPVRAVKHVRNAIMVHYLYSVGDWNYINYLPEDK